MKKETEKQEHGHQKHGFQITINSKKHEWPEPSITGRDIRKIGDIPPEDEIFLKKPKEDEPVEDADKVDLSKEGVEHFYSEKHKEVVILVNGTEHKWPRKKISFIEVIKLAFGVYHDNPNWIYTVAYEDGPKQNPEGSMIKGQEVFVKHRMIFHVKATDQS